MTEAFWRRHVLLGMVLMAFEAFAALVYAWHTPNGPNRPALMAVMGTATAAGPCGVIATRWLASRRWRAHFVLVWGLGCLAVIAVGAYIDGGLESPLLYLVVLPLAYAAGLLDPIRVAVVGTAAISAVAMVGLTDADVRLPQQDVWMFAAAVGGAVVLAFGTAFSRAKLMQEGARLVERLEAMAAVDLLTGCWNQGTFQRRLREEADAAVRYRRPLSLAVCDVDLFKSYNDTYGHDRGDAALARLGARLRETARSSDVVARIGGDEFAILMPDTGLTDATNLANRIASRCRDDDRGPSLSIGVATCGAETCGALDLFHAADAAMYDAKAEGRGMAVASDGRSRPEPAVSSADHRRMAERIRQEQRRRLETETVLDVVLREAPICFALVDTDLRVVRANPAMAQFARRAVEDLPGLPLADAVPDLWPELERQLHQVLHESLPVRNLEITQPGADGAAMVTRLGNLYPVRTNGRPSGVGLVFVDITDRKRLERAQESLTDAVVSVLAAASEARDPYTAGHQRRVADIAAAAATALGYDEFTVRGVRLAATIHDVGKIAVPAEILAKPGRLTDAEYAIVKEHPQIGHDLLSGIAFPWPVADMVAQHHERLNGSGYPAGLRDDEIGIGARIIAVADVIEAMSAHRPYRPALGIDTAIATVEAGRGTLFDADVVDVSVAYVRQRSRMTLDAAIG